MTDAEIAQFVGYLFIAYSSGWFAGLLLHWFKKATEYL